MIPLRYNWASCHPMPPLFDAVNHGDDDDDVDVIHYLIHHHWNNDVTVVVVAVVVAAAVAVVVDDDASDDDHDVPVLRLPSTMEQMRVRMVLRLWHPNNRMQLKLPLPQQPPQMDLY